jgi:hypothetical protein
MNTSKTLAGLIGQMKARRIIKKYFPEQYPLNNEDTGSAIAMVNALSDQEILSVQGLGPMALQSIRKACEEIPDPQILPASFSLNPDEDKVIYLLADAWNAFLKLPELHPDDIPDFRKCINDAQRIIQSRPAIANLKVPI